MVNVGSSLSKNRELEFLLLDFICQSKRTSTHLNMCFMVQHSECHTATLTGGETLRSFEKSRGTSTKKRGGSRSVQQTDDQTHAV